MFRVVARGLPGPEPTPSEKEGRMSDVVRALWTGFAGHELLTKDELWAADHPLVVAHPDWFSDDIYSIARGARPGGPPEPKRGPGRPRKIETTERNIEVTE